MVTWYIFQRPCGCGQPIFIAANNPMVAVLKARGYKHIGTFTK